MTRRKRSLSAEKLTGTEKRSTAVKLLRAFAVVVVVALVVVTGIDGYFNQWGTVKTILNWNSLELTGVDGFDWELRASRDFALVRLEAPAILAEPESLAAFDRPFREAGMYRLYFRLSDSASSTLKILYEKIGELDTAGTMQHSLQDAERAYTNIRRLLGIDTAAVHLLPPKASKDSVGAADTLRSPGVMGSGAITEGDLGLGSTRDVTTVVSRLLGKSPYAIAGVGIGILASAGLDLLKGEAYVASARRDVFQIDNLRAGARVGRWEGKDIDILWVSAPAMDQPVPKPDSASLQMPPQRAAADSSTAPAK